MLWMKQFVRCMRLLIRLGFFCDTIMYKSSWWVPICRKLVTILVHWLLHLQAIKSPQLQYSHFVSIPLALHTKLLDSVVEFQKSVLEFAVASSSDGKVNHSLLLFAWHFAEVGALCSYWVGAYTSVSRFGQELQAGHWQVHICEACDVSFDSSRVEALERRASASCCWSLTIMPFSQLV